MNKHKNGKNIVLAIETAVQGGSLSLLEKGKEVDFWQGSGSISKSADVLDEISRLFQKNKIKKNQIEQIVVSRGPGSFTGTRIGLALALGLKKSLGCDICGVSVLEAMAWQAVGNKNIFTAIPFGTKQVCLQKFQIGQKRELNIVKLPGVMLFETFVQFLKVELEASFVLYGKLHKVALEQIQTEHQIIKRMANCGENLAHLIGLLANEKPASDNLQPIYVQAARER